MDRKNTFMIVCVVLVACIAIGYIYFQRGKVESGVPLVNDDLSWQTKPATESTSSDEELSGVISAKHAFSNGKHTIVGEIAVPTPCHILETNATVASDKQQAIIDFTSSIKTGEMCAQSVTPARFKISFDADKNAKISARHNGKVVTLNLIEATPGEDLDKYELYIKG